MSTGSGDALMIVDSNVGFNKVDGNVSRLADYAVTVDSSGTARATLTITYTNLSNPVESFCVHQPYYLTDYAELEQGCYWDYARVIAPARSELIDATRDLGAAAEALPQGRTEFGGYFVLARGESKSIHFEYRAPAILKDGSNYILRLEKQPGAPTMPVAVNVTLPNGWSVKSVDPSSARVAGNVVELNVTLDRDQDISVAFERPLPPAALFSGFSALGLAAGIVLWLYRRRKKRA